jgi:3-phosphoshikimate 1-carboxyvinyltransferase
MPTRLEVEGDWSSASYFLALGAVSKEGITVNNLSTSTLQGDRVILDFLRRMGADVKVAGNSVTVREGTFKAVRADLSDCIDLLPTIAILAALADGQSEFTGIERARIKESNRVTAVKEGLQKLGVTVTEGTDRLTIIGLKTPKKVEESMEEEVAKDLIGKPEEPEKKGPVLIDTHDDHRIAMAFGVFGAAEGNVVINGAECVAKTYPGFWDTFKGLGGEIKTNV